MLCPPATRTDTVMRPTRNRQDCKNSAVGTPISAQFTDRASVRRAHNNIVSAQPSASRFVSLSLTERVRMMRFLFAAVVGIVAVLGFGQTSAEAQPEPCPQHFAGGTPP